MKESVFNHAVKTNPNQQSKHLPHFPEDFSQTNPTSHFPLRFINPPQLSPKPCAHTWQQLHSLNSTLLLPKQNNASIYSFIKSQLEKLETHSNLLFCRCSIPWQFCSLHFPLSQLWHCHTLPSMFTIKKRINKTKPNIMDFISLPFLRLLHHVAWM